MARLNYDKVTAVSNFLDTLGLVPRILITKPVVDLITQSWEREFQREDLEEQKKQEAKEFIIKLSQRKRKSRPILDNMIPINFEPLYEDVHTAYNETDTFK